MPNALRALKTTATFVLAAGILGVSVAGCSKSKSKVTAPPASTTPVADSPVHATALLQWCWQHQAIAEFQQLLTGDYSFVYSNFDPTGDHFTGRVLTDSQEVSAAGALFAAGVGGLPPARAIGLILGTPGTPLSAVNDPRPGKTAKWHQMVATRFDLAVETDVASYRTVGSVQFYWARGDSAAVPTLLNPAAEPDSNRWYLEAWGEEPIASAAGGIRPAASSSPQPTEQATWGYLKWLYLGSPGGLP